MADGPVLLIGCGRLGSAIVEGWLDHGPVEAAELLIQTPSSKPVAERAARFGAIINPEAADLARATRVVVAVKPKTWRSVLGSPSLELHPSAVIVSVMAGVRAADIANLTGREVARVMPTTAVAQAQGVAAVWAENAAARETAEALFAPVADVVPLASEGDLDLATAVAGSGPAFVFAFVQAMANAGERLGLDSGIAERLARGALVSAASQVRAGGDLQCLTDRIASPGGTTRAGLNAMSSLQPAVDRAIDAAVHRARQLSQD